VAHLGEQIALPSPLIAIGRWLLEVQFDVPDLRFS
jgi:hypothetical protein